MRQAAVLRLHLFFRDEGHGGVIVRKVVGHGLDRLFDRRLVRTFLCDDVALSGVHLACGQFRLLAASDSCESCFHRHGVLACVFHARNSADRIGVSLADAPAPEGVNLAVRKDRIAVDPRQRKQARIPAAGDQREMAGFLCGAVYVFEVLRDVRVRVKAVDDVEILHIFRRLLRQVSGASAADDEHVDLVAPLRRFRRGDDLHVRRRLHGRGIPPRENCRKLQIVIARDRRLDPSAQVTVTHNADSNTHLFPSIFLSASAVCCSSD